MIVVVSQAWTKQTEEHAQGYIALNEEFGRFFRSHPGFRGRRLVRGQENPWHFTHLRFFDTVESYEECTKAEGYVEHTVLMYEHLEPYDSYPREYLDVVIDELDPTLAGAPE